VISEAGDIRQPQGPAPDLGPQLVNPPRSREARWDIRGGPLLGRQQVGLDRTAQSAQASQLLHRVRGDLQRRHRLHGIRMAHLRLSHAEQGPLLAEVDFDTPALDEALDQGAQIQLETGTDEKRRLTIQQPGTFAEAVAQRSNRDHLQSVPEAGGAPQDLPRVPDAYPVSGAADGHLQRGPGLGVSGAQLYRSRGRSAVAAGAAYQGGAGGSLFKTVALV